MWRRVHLFHLACALGDLVNVRTLLKNGCSISSLFTERREALLHCACGEGDMAVVDAVIDAGCNVNCRFCDGNAFFFWRHSPHECCL